MHVLALLGPKCARGSNWQDMGRRNLASSSSHAWLVVVVLVCVLSHQVAGANARPGPRSRFDRIQDVLTTSENTLRWLRDLDIGPSDSPSEWKVPLLRPAPPKPKVSPPFLPITFGSTPFSIKVRT